MSAFSLVAALAGTAQASTEPPHSSNSSYFITVTAQSHAGCAAECVAAGGALACIDSDSDTAAAASLLLETETYVAWFGLHQYPTDQGAEAGWKPSALRCDPGYRNWAFGQPNNRRVDEDCATVQGPSGKQRDQPCEWRFHCLCERSAEMSPDYASDYALADEAAVRRATPLFVAYLAGCGGFSLTLLVLVLVRRCHRRVAEETATFDDAQSQRASLRAPATGRAAAYSKLRRSEAVRKRLRGATRQNRRLAADAKEAVLALAATCIVWGVTPWLMYSADGGYWPTRLAHVNPISLVCIAIPAIPLFFLSLRPTDVQEIRVGCALFLIGCLGLALYGPWVARSFSTVALSDPAGLCWYYAAQSVIGLAGAALTAYALTARTLPPRQQLAVLLASARLVLGILGLLVLGYFGLRAARLEKPYRHHPSFLPIMAAGASLVGSSLFLLSPWLRGHALAALGRLGSTKEEREAALLASLCSFRRRMTQKELLHVAEAEFRCIRFDRLCFEDLAECSRGGANSAPSSRREGSAACPSPVGPKAGAADFAERTERCGLGEVDCFISHSWHDPPAAKWEALKAWASTFEDRHGRTPRLWFDKACLDQDDITRALPCLPIFIAGCRSLLILAGPTYASRLWCVMELFAYLKMGGRREAITVVPIAACATEEGLQTVSESLAAFDAQQARCVLPADRHHFLAVIESSYGSLSQFNLWARTVLEERSTRRSPALQRSAARSCGTEASSGGTPRRSVVSTAATVVSVAEPAVATDVGGEDADAARGSCGRGSCGRGSCGRVSSVRFCDHV